ncbi:HAD family hydrolase [Terribacillus halophilus]|uniref:HAD family hydrolase n=2 Tax=Terribacillus TaxID=459532 RepID=UPI0039827112
MELISMLHADAVKKSQQKRGWNHRQQSIEGKCTEKPAKKLDFSKGEIIAVGDSMNDRIVLETAGTKVVLGNAAEEVKQHCD